MIKIKNQFKIQIIKKIFKLKIINYKIYNNNNNNNNNNKCKKVKK